VAAESEAHATAGLSALRSQLVEAVKREVAARGAAQELAELLREQQARRYVYIYIYI